MACDGVRIDAYAEAIARSVKPGDVVLDIGCGTGIFTLLALRAGAKHVHAVDPNPAIWLLPDLARENGAFERVTIHPKSSFEVQLDARADVIVSDLRGSLPLCAEHTAVVQDARARLLRPGGVLIPTRDRLMVALVESEQVARSLREGWEAFTRLGFSAEAARTSVLNTFYSDGSHPLIASDVLTNDVGWSTIEYATYDGRILEGTADLTARRSGTAHGLAVWFEATLVEGVEYRTAPGWALAYGRSFLPLIEPVHLDRGDRANVTLRADARGERWAWDTELSTRAGTKRFRQATFLGKPTSPQALLQQSSSYRPRLSPRGERTRAILLAMKGERTVSELAQELAAAPLPDDSLRAGILDEVREAVERYAR
jgi:protein arginine N-methyltransferase 1